MKLSIDKLIQSKSLRNYLKFIRHEFSETEEAMLIYFKDMATYKERIALFEEFIEGKDESAPLIQNIKKWIIEVGEKINWCLDPVANPYEGSVCEDVEFAVDDDEIYAMVDDNIDEYPDLQLEIDGIIFHSFDEAINFVRDFRNNNSLSHTQFYIRIDDWYDDEEEDIPGMKSTQVTKILIDENYDILEIDFCYNKELNSDSLTYLMNEKLTIPNNFKHGYCVKAASGSYGVVDRNNYPEFEKFMREKECDDGEAPYVYNMTFVPVQLFDGINMQYVMISPKCLELLDVDRIPNDIKLLSDIMRGKFPITLLSNLIKGHVWDDIVERSCMVYGEDDDTTEFIYNTCEEIFEDASGFKNSTEYLNTFNLTEGIVLED